MRKSSISFSNKNLLFESSHSNSSRMTRAPPKQKAQSRLVGRVTKLDLGSECPCGKNDDVRGKYESCLVRQYDTVPGTGM